MNIVSVERSESTQRAHSHAATLILYTNKPAHDDAARDFTSLSASYLIKFHFFARRRDYLIENDGVRQKHLC